MGFSVVILAAGQGTRMRSAQPKVLHKLAGKSLLGHVVDRARQLAADNIQIVYGHGGAQVKAAFPDEDLHWVEQSQQLGTGHAVQQALPSLDNEDRVLILYGDVPLISERTLASLVEFIPEQGIALLTVNLLDPTGYGRIVRNADGKVTAIVEHKDANPGQLEIQEVNTGIMALNAGDLGRWLGKIDDDNAQGEFYLTDIIAMAAEAGGVHTVQPGQAFEVEGINSRRQLATLERLYQQCRAEWLQDGGVTLADPARFDLRGELACGRDGFFDINVVIEGSVTLGENVHLEQNVLLRDCYIGDNCRIKANSVIEGARLEAGCEVGPFARLRPGTHLRENAFIGNFVETKKIDMGRGSKASHLAYLGDAEIGERVNIGAGTITCNYDGANKHKTVIGDEVFIGSDSQLVAPVRIGKGATIGAGTTVTADVKEEQLCISRVKQKQIDGWQRPKKQKS